MKKNFTISLSLIIRHSSLIIPLMAFAIGVLMPARVMANVMDEVDGIWYDFNTQNHTDATVVSPTGTPYAGDIVIPRTVLYDGHEYRVTAIGERAFSFCAELTSVVLPNTVKVIAEYAFFECDNLTAVEMTGNLTTIAKAAFYQCRKLAAVTIPVSVTTIGEDAFASCSSLASIAVERGNTVYDSRRDCNAVIHTASNTLIVGCKYTVIPNSVTAIGNDAFNGCTGLAALDLPGSVTSIGDYAFAGCSNLPAVVVPANVTAIGAAAFSDCYKLKNIAVESGNTVYDSRDDCNAIIETATNTLISGCQNTVIPNSVTVIGQNAFTNQSMPETLIIPGSVTTIGALAFAGCRDLKSVTIPGSVTTIERAAFSNCYRMTTLIIGSGVTSIGETAFSLCSKLAHVYCYAKNVPSTSDNAFSHASIGTATLHVPESAIDAYWTAAPWSGFGSIKALAGKCATPAIAMVDGKLRYTCETEGAQFRTSVTFHSSKETGGSEVALSGKVVCHVSVYATKTGYEDSDVATKDVELNVGTRGDVNGDGAVSPADAIEALYIFFGVSPAHAPQKTQSDVEPQ